MIDPANRLTRLIHKSLLTIATIFFVVNFRSVNADEPVIDVYVSTGDNHFLGSSLPIDSPESIEATFDFFRDVQHARRIYWRGLEEACWLSTMHVRPENLRGYSFWKWLEWLYVNVKPDELAVQAAHARGMEIWGMGSLWDWGSQADTPGFTDYPFAYESKLRIEHPEWVPVDKHGVRRQGGPIELAYPQARTALVDLIVKETLKVGYDGICFLSYVENYSLRFDDEFGYSDPIVEDFKSQYKIDIRKQPFRRGASHEDWLRLRGSYVTAFLRELKTELDKHNVKLGMVVNSNDPRLPQSWNVPELMITAGSQLMDVETWVSEALVDELVIYGNNSGQSQLKALRDLQWLCRDAGTQVSVLTSGPFRDVWKPYQKNGMATVLAVGSDGEHLARGFIPEQRVDALKGDSLAQRMRALEQCISGSLAADEATLVKLSTSSNLIERRLALLALGKLPNSTNIEPLLAGLRDSENGVRCAAALALSHRRDPSACSHLLRTVEQHGNHMLRECVIIALRRLSPVPLKELTEAALHARQGRVREVAMRTLEVYGDESLLQVFTVGLKDEARFPRYAAAKGLANLHRSKDAVEILMDALQNHDDIAVVNRAAVSLGVFATRDRPETKPLRQQMLDSLVASFKRHGQESKRSDADWGWRVIGNAILEFGEEGTAALHKLRDQREDMQLAELAWRVVDLTQRTATFSSVTPAQNDEAMLRQPAHYKIDRGRDLHVNQKTGDDSRDGVAGPVRTIARAIKLAKPGDTIHLTPGTWHESADLTNKHGYPGKPITLDGHGAILDGSEPVRAADWESLGDGLFRKVKLMRRMNAAIIGRWFFLWDGTMNRMGRTSKGPSKPLKKPDDLQDNEWTYVKAEDAFYIRLPKNQTLEQANIRYPARSNAVVESLSGSYLVVRNITGTHVYNDGFNIHGAQKNMVFENIAAIECGDDGFSAHEDAECRIIGFTSIGNSTGLCDTVSSITHYKNVFIKECHGYDIYFIGDSPHSMQNAIIESSAVRPVVLEQHTDRPQQGPGTVMLQNVLIRRVASIPGELRVNKGTKLEMKNCTLLGLNVMVTSGGEVSIHNSIIAGDRKPEILLFSNTIWRGDGNHYDFKTLRVGRTSFTQKTFADFQKLTGSEAASYWESKLEIPTDVGADPAVLMHLDRNSKNKKEK